MMDYIQYKTYSPAFPRLTKYHDSFEDAAREQRRQRENGHLVLIARVVVSEKVGQA